MSSEPAWTFGRYYCAHCPVDPRSENWANAFQVKNHVFSEHGEASPVEGVDFYQGWQAAKKYKARRLVADSYAGHAAFGDPNYGVEDFLTDAGLDAPPEAPCERPEKTDG